VQGESRPVADPIALPQPLTDQSGAMLDARHCEALDESTRQDIVQAMAFDELRTAGSVPLVQRSLAALRPVSSDRGSRVAFEENVDLPIPGKLVHDATSQVGTDLTGTAGSADRQNAEQRQRLLQQRSTAQKKCGVELADSTHWQ